jgi:hypothetical protein
MANTTKLSKEDRKKSKRTARKKRKAEKPLKPRDYPRGSKEAKGQEIGPRPGEAVEDQPSFARRTAPSAPIRGSLAAVPS